MNWPLRDIIDAICNVFFTSTTFVSTVLKKQTMSADFSSGATAIYDLGRIKSSAVSSPITIGGATTV